MDKQTEIKRIKEVEMKKIFLIAVMFFLLSSVPSYAIQCKDYYDFFDDLSNSGIDPQTLWDKADKEDKIHNQNSEEKICLDIWSARKILREKNKEKFEEAWISKNRKEN